MWCKENIQEAVRCLKALAHPTRLEILCVLRDGKSLCVNYKLC